VIAPDLQLELARWLAVAVVQASALALVAVAVDRWGSRRVWPEIRHALWLAVVARLLLPPNFHAPLLDSPITAGWSGVFDWTREVAADAPRGSEGFDTSTQASNGAVARGSDVTSDVTSVVVSLWALGVAVSIASRMAVAARDRRRRRLRASAAPSRELLETLVDVARIQQMKVPRIAIREDLAGAEVRGLFRAEILMPRAYAEHLGPVEMRQVLAHELAHLKRGDLWIDLLLEFARTIYWFLPTAHLAAERVRQLREPCCDAAVLRALGSDPSYRRTLLRLALTSPASPGTALARSGVAAEFLRPRPSALVRAEWLARSSRRRERAASFAAMFVFAIAAGCVLPPAERRLATTTAASAAAPASLGTDDENARTTLRESLAGGRPGSLRLQAAARRLTHRPA